MGIIPFLKDVHAAMKLPTEYRIIAFIPYSIVFKKIEASTLHFRAPSIGLVHLHTSACKLWWVLSWGFQLHHWCYLHCKIEFIVASSERSRGFSFSSQTFSFLLDQKASRDSTNWSCWLSSRLFREVKTNLKMLLDSSMKHWALFQQPEIFQILWAFRKLKKICQSDSKLVSHMGHILEQGTPYRLGEFWFASNCKESTKEKSWFYGEYEVTKFNSTLHHITS